MCELLVMNIDKIKQTTDTIITIIITMIKYGHTDTKNKRTDTLDTFSKQKRVALKQQVMRRVRKGEVLLILILIEE